LSQLVDEARRQVLSLAYEGITNIMGVNKSSVLFNDTHKLSFPFAVKVVGDWYSTSEGYDFNEEPTTTTAGIF